MLLTGIGYGVYRHRSLQRQEDERRHEALQLRNGRTWFEQTASVERTVSAEDTDIMGPLQDDENGRSVHYLRI